MRIKEITSPQNPLIKDFAQLLTKSKERRRQGIFLIEGFREVERALSTGYPIKSLLYCPVRTSVADVEALLNRSQKTWTALNPKGIQHIHCSEKAFAKVAYRSEITNMVAVAERVERTQADLLLKLKHDQEQNDKDQPMILILEGIEKPGNLGAILRSADAFGVDAVILVNCSAELEHPNSLRNSLGAALALPIIELGLSHCVELLEQLEIPLYVTHLNAESLPPTELALQQACALVLGAEATGASDDWFKAQPQAQAVLIPMVEQRVVDSLNVSVAAAVVLYEVNRQRTL